ncbi:MAG: hypothetical protein KC776_02895 [Myxococcales bacterium]|nr:hypothetical protein [Myxococcales bacterium]MCB9577926.1 hypothetical protein [Polyangiaceae bacterium]
MIGHLCQSIASASRQAWGTAALAALAVGLVAGLVLILASPKRLRAISAVVLGVSSVGALGVALSTLLGAQQQALAEHGLRSARERAEVGHTLLALVVTLVAVLSGVLALARLANQRRGGTVLPACVAVVSGVLGYGLLRRIDLAYHEVECAAASPCLRDVVLGTVALTSKLEIAIVISAIVGTVALAFTARRIAAVSRLRWLSAGAVFVLGALSFAATRSRGLDGSQPLPERELGRIACSFPGATAAGDSNCSACRLARPRPVIEIQPDNVLIDGRSSRDPRALRDERARHSGGGARLPPPAVVLVDPRAPLAKVAPTLARLRDDYWHVVELARPETSARVVRTHTLGEVPLPAQCCCVQVDLVRGAPEATTWAEAAARASATGRLALPSQE